MGKSEEAKNSLFPAGQSGTTRERKNSLNCLLCGKETEPAEPNYCRAHHRALDSVKQAYGAWKTAYGSLSPSDFLGRIERLPGTGQNARDIVKFLLRNPSRWK